MAFGAPLYVNGQLVAGPYMMAHVPVSGLGSFLSSKKKRAANKAKRQAKKAKRQERKAIRKEKRKKVLKNIGKVFKTAGAVTAAVTLSPATLLVTTKQGRKIISSPFKKKKGKKGMPKPVLDRKKQVAELEKANRGFFSKFRQKQKELVKATPKPSVIKTTPKGMEMAAKVIAAEAPVTDAVVANEVEVESTGMSLGMKLALAGAGVAAVGGLAYVLLRKGGSSAARGRTATMAANRRRRRRR